jgi:signal transduction histidine kinase
MAISGSTSDANQDSGLLTPESLIEVFFHKLSQPLGTLYGTLELASMSSEPARHKAAIASGLEQIEKLKWLFQIMRRFFGEDFTQDCERVSLKSILEDAVQNCRPLADDRGVAIRCKLENELLVLANPRHLAHALENLLAHSIKSSKSGGTVQIEARCEESLIIARIADDAQWNPEQVANMFDPFPPGKELLPGDADHLDTCLSRRIIQAYGGDVAVRFTPALTRVLEITLSNANQKQQ